jgi:hypothetical protein
MPLRDTLDLRPRNVCEGVLNQGRGYEPEPVCFHGLIGVQAAGTLAEASVPDSLLRERCVHMKGLHVIFVHGITETVITWDYTAKMAQMVLTEFRKDGLIRPDATQEEIDQIITFDRVNYSAMGSEEEEHLLETYIAETKKLYNFVYRLSQMAGLDKIRRQLINSVSDVMVYESAYWRNIIHEMVSKTIDPYVGSGDSVSLIGHSLGSVVAFDTIHQNNEENPKWLAANFRPTNLFTMGSPLALFTLDMDHSTGEPSSRHKAHPDQKRLLEEDGVWYNFVDAQDIIAYPLELLFEQRFQIVDVVVQTGTNPHKAHAGYWDSAQVAHTIAGRLKMDYKRINEPLADRETEEIAHTSPLG